MGDILGLGHAHIGHCEYRLVERDGQLRIAAKRAMIDRQTLAPNGAVSMIL